MQRAPTWIVATALLVSLLWAVAAGWLAAERWPPTGAALAHERDAGVRGCASRYPEPSARERCEILFETQYVMERNIALFTRALIALAPALAVGGWALARRRKAAAGRRR